MLKCPSCERTKDLCSFPHFFMNQLGVVCKRCLSDYKDAPIDHWWQRKFNNSGIVYYAGGVVESMTKKLNEKKEVLN